MSITIMLGRYPRIAAVLVAVFATSLVACGNIEATISTARATPSPTATPVATLPPTPTPSPASRYATSRLLLNTPRPPQTPQMGQALSDMRVAEIMALLLDRDPDELILQEALDEVVANRDVRFVAPLVELMRAGPMQLGDLSQAHIDALETLTGWGYSQSWDRWVEWYGRSGLTPPPGFATWKGVLLGRLDDRYRGHISDDQSTTIAVDQLVWSGALPDHTVPLDDPVAVAADSPAAAYLDPDEPVFGVVVNGEARAYPMQIMDVHQLANDVVGGVPVTLGYCALTGSAVLLDRRAPDGQTYSFSSSGLVYQSNQLMYDRQTSTLWSPLLGRPVLGPLVDTAAGTEGPWLDAIPIVTARWGEWVEQHPDTTVLSADTGLSRGYRLGFPHLEYFVSGDASYPVAPRDDRQLTKAWVYGITIEGDSKAYPLRTVFDEHVVNDRLGQQDLVVVGGGRGRGIRVDAESMMLGEVRYFVGGTIRAYARPADVTFAPGPTSDTVVDQEGGAWQVTEEALVSPTGEAAPRLFGQLLYWFGWQAFHPDTDVYDSMLPTAGP